MFKQLARNTVFSSLAYFGTGLLSLFIIPVIINAYGLTAFGLIVLARIFLPTGFMAMFDFGISETATQAVARARAREVWPVASQQTTLLLVSATTIGVAAGSILIIGGPWAPHLFQVDKVQWTSFSTVIQVTGVALMILYPGLLLEGVIKGLEQYGLLRLCETLSALGYVLLTLWVVHEGLSYETVAYAFLATTVLKYVGLAIFAIPLLQKVPLRLSMWDRNNRAEVFHRSLLMFQSKIVGSIQGQSSPLFIGSIIGPAGVAVYDVLIRLPRFAKVVLGLINSALLPVAARLDERGDHAMMQRLGSTGFWLWPTITFPIILCAALFAEEILREWLGPTLVHFWPWLSLAFIVPLFGIFLSFGQTLMQVKPQFLATSNRLASLQVILQIALSLGFVGWFYERAFILGQVAALLMVFPLQIRLLLVQQGLRPSLLISLIGKHAIIALPLTALSILTRHFWPIHGMPSLALAAIGWCMVYWVGLYGLMLSQEERIKVRKIVVTALGR